MNSFQTAIIRAGGGWVGVTGEQGCSMEKGESLRDTIGSYSNYVDIIALRHKNDNAAKIAAEISKVPVINSGCGSKEHAVGGLMMLSNYIKIFDQLDGLKIGLYGTPEINRVSKAMVPIMGYYGVTFFIDDLGHFPLPREVEDSAKKNGLAELKYDKMENFISDIDILIVTRGLQKGIIPEGKFPKEKEEIILNSYKPINKEHMKKLRKDAYLSMIVPRIFEIEKDVDNDPRSLYTQKGAFQELIMAVMSYYMEIKV